MRTEVSCLTREGFGDAPGNIDTTSNNTTHPRAHRSATRGRSQQLGDDLRNRAVPQGLVCSGLEQLARSTTDCAVDGRLDDRYRQVCACAGCATDLGRCDTGGAALGQSHCGFGRKIAARRTSEAVDKACEEVFGDTAA